MPTEYPIATSIYVYIYNRHAPNASSQELRQKWLHLNTKMTILIQHMDQFLRSKETSSSNVHQADFVYIESQISVQ